MFNSVVQLVNLDLNFLELFKELLQVNFAELDTLRPIHVLTWELFEVSLLNILVVLTSLFICLKVKWHFANGCPDISSEHALLAGCRVIKDCVARLLHTARVEGHREHPVEIFEYAVRCDYLSLHKELVLFFFDLARCLCVNCLLDHIVLLFLYLIFIIY